MPYVVMVYVTDESALEAWKDPDVMEDGERLVGIYRMPDKTEITCNGSCPTRDKKKSGWSRQEEFGYDVHECGLPNPRWRSGVGKRLVAALGYNLLADRLTPRIFRNPDQQYRLDFKAKR